MKYLNNILFILLSIIIFLSFTSILINLSEVIEFKKELTGFALGYVNVTIQSSVHINISRDTINWGAGVIDSGEPNATLYTNGEGNGLVERGNWTGNNVKAFIVENTGGINCSLSLQTNKDAHDFFNSSLSANEQYQWNVTNKEENACSGIVSLGVWHEVNKTSGGTIYCEQLDFNQERDEIYIDILLTVPRDSRNIGSLSDTITITGNVAV